MNVSLFENEMCEPKFVLAEQYRNPESMKEPTVLISERAYTSLYFDSPASLRRFGERLLVLAAEAARIVSAPPVTLPRQKEAAQDLLGEMAKAVPEGARIAN